MGLMSTGTVANLVLVLVFILIGGVFAATEIALISLRESQIRQMAERGRRGARTAALARDPNRFLSTVQIGVTVAGFFSAAYGASTIAPDLAPTLRAWGLPAGLADALALVGTTLVIAYLSLVLGELVPKRIALQRSTGVSLVTAPPLDRFAALMRPVIWLLSVSTDALVRLLGADPSRKGEEITHDELRELLVGHTAVSDDERRLLAEVLDAGERSLTAVMRPRTEVDFHEADMPVEVAQHQAITLGHSRFPVTDGSLDDICGFVHVRDLRSSGPGDGRTVTDLCRPILEFPGTKPALATLTEMRRANAQIAIVVDEYGGTAGIVTLEDLLEEIVGEIRDEFDPPRSLEHPARRLRHETVDGLLLVEDFEQQTGLRLPSGPYETVAGCVLHHMQRLPHVGDSVTIAGHRFTVCELDGHRIARLRVTDRRRIPTPAS